MAAIAELVAKKGWKRGMQTKLAKHYSVSQEVMNHVFTGKTWTHITGGPLKKAGADD